MSPDLMTKSRQNTFLRNHMTKPPIKKTISYSRFGQGKTLAAEQSILEAIEIIVDLWEIHHPWVLEFKQVLEGWLRGWGREKDADRLRKDMEEFPATNQNDG